MAQAYPASTFVGYDYHEASIQEARCRAAEAGASLAQQGRVALGTQAGFARLDDLIRTAWFTRVRKAAQSPFNIVLEAQP